MRSDIRSSASDIITQAERIGRSSCHALAVGLDSLSEGSTSTRLTFACHWHTIHPLGSWGLWPQVLVPQQDCREVNCAATWNDRTRHSIRKRRDRQAPAHNPLCVANYELLGSSISVSSFVKKQLTLTR